MSEEKRFKDRKSEFPNRWRGEIVSQSSNQIIMDLYRSNGNVEEAGTAINAELFNEFNDSIEMAVSLSTRADKNAESAISKASTALTNSNEALMIASNVKSIVDNFTQTTDQPGTAISINNVRVDDLNFTSDPQTQLDLKLDENKLLDKVYPVGSIYMSMSATNPGTLIGGTWERWANGRVPLSQSDSDVDFKTAGNVGGDKNFQSHNHCLEVNDSTGLTGTLAFKTYSSAPTPTGVFTETWSDSGVTPSGTNKDKNVKIDFNGNHKHTGVTDYHGTGQGKNMPPYMVCYMWRRTA